MHSLQTGPGCALLNYSLSKSICSYFWGEGTVRGPRIVRLVAFRGLERDPRLVQRTRRPLFFAAPYSGIGPEAPRDRRPFASLAEEREEGHGRWFCANRSIREATC